MTTPWQIVVGALWLLFIALAVVTAAIMRQIGVLSLAMRSETPGSGPPTHSKAPRFNGDDVLGTGVWRWSRHLGQPRLIVFLSSACGGCQTLIAAVHELMKQHSEVAIVGLVSEPPARAREFAQRERVAFPLLTEAETQAFATYNVLMTEVVPTVVELRAGGRLSEFSQTVEAATSGVAVAMVV